MRIDPKGTIVGYPALLVRRALRQLDLHVEWDLGRLEAITGEGRAFVKALTAAGLVEPTRGLLVDHMSGEGIIIRDSRPALEAHDGREGTGRVPGARGLPKSWTVLPRVRRQLELLADDN
jgi:hypothetical protein